MLPNDPIDILAIASQRQYNAGQALHYANMMQSSEAAQLSYDLAWVEYRAASEDLDDVRTLIRELSRAN